MSLQFLKSVISAFAFSKSNHNIIIHYYPKKVGLPKIKLSMLLRSSPPVKIPQIRWTEGMYDKISIEVKFQLFIIKISILQCLFLCHRRCCLHVYCLICYCLYVLSWFFCLSRGEHLVGLPMPMILLTLSRFLPQKKSLQI